MSEPARVRVSPRGRRAIIGMVVMAAIAISISLLIGSAINGG